MEYYDLVEQECPAPTGSAAFDFSASGSLTGRHTFDSRLTTTGQTCTYTARDGSGNVETGLGTWDEAAKTLTRTTIYYSSNGDAAESFSGTVTVAADWLQRQAKNAYLKSKSHIHFENSAYVTYVSSTSIKINGGGEAVVNGELLTWTSDITWSGTSGVAPLAAQGLIYGYLYSNSGTPTLEVSTTAAEWDSTNRYWRKTSDSTRRCVWAGYAWSTTAPAYRIAPFSAIASEGMCSIVYHDDYVDGSNAFDRVDMVVASVASSNSTDVNPTSMTLTHVPVHAKSWICDARMDGGTSSGADAILAVGSRDRSSASQTVDKWGVVNVRGQTGVASGSIFFGNTVVDIETARTAYYGLDVLAGTAGLRILDRGWRADL